MNIKIGCDIINIGKLEKSAHRGKEKFLNKIFTPRELTGEPSWETLAGIFAAKEAVVKALGIPAGKWQEIEILKEESGKPRLEIKGRLHAYKSHDISVSHDGDYAIAFVCFLED